VQRFEIVVRLIAIQYHIVSQRDERAREDENDAGVAMGD